MVANLNSVVFYCRILTLEKVGTAVNYSGIIALEPGPSVIKLDTVVIYCLSIAIP